MDVLTINAGSSSLKLAVVDDGARTLERWELTDEASAGWRDKLVAVLGSCGSQVTATAHRVVHGGCRRDPVLADEAVLAELDRLDDLAPLHQRATLTWVREVAKLRPDLPQVLCFDTAFHARLAPAAARFAVPGEWAELHGLRRYGFHGLSHAHSSSRAAQLLGVPAAELRLVTCHLGAGASLAAVVGGRSVDTTMGMTPNDGLVMATRSGAVDVSGVLCVAGRLGLTPAETRAKLEHESGLLGLSGLSGDMRDVIAAAEAGHERARVAVDVYLHRLRAGIAAMAASLGGLDALAFTGGVGERSAQVRMGACGGLGFIGVEIDDAANRGCRGEGDVSHRRSRVRVLVVECREELELAAAARGLLTPRAARADSLPAAGGIGHNGGDRGHAPAGR